MKYSRAANAPKTWHHKFAPLYQMRMKRRPTRAERRFDQILDEALKGFTLTEHKPTQVNLNGPKRKFKKQKIFEDQIHHKAYIVDFFIPDVNLVFEIDGPSHNNPEQQVYDSARTEFLGTRGIQVIRILNEETLDPVKLAGKIKAIMNDRIKSIRTKNDLKSDPRFFTYLYGYVPRWAKNKIDGSRWRR